MPAKRNLFTIGDFSRITGVGIHSLRYYDEIGVLRPAYVDPVSNYRYYSFDQLCRIPGINICLDAGIRLSEFDRFLEDGRINYDKLLSDSRDAIERKIDEFRTQQKDLERIELQLKVTEAAANSEAVSVKTEGYDLWTVPAGDEAAIDNEADMLIRISAHAKRHGCQISPVCFGLLQKNEGGAKRTYEFAQIRSANESARSSEFFYHLNAGSYILKACDSCSIRNAEEMIPASRMHENDILLSFFLIRGHTTERLCFSVVQDRE